MHAKCNSCPFRAHFSENGHEWRLVRARCNPCPFRVHFWRPFFCPRVHFVSIDPNKSRKTQGKYIFSVDIRTHGLAHGPAQGRPKTPWPSPCTTADRWSLHGPACTLSGPCAHRCAFLRRAEAQASEVGHRRGRPRGREQALCWVAQEPVSVSVNATSLVKAFS